MQDLRWNTRSPDSIALKSCVYLQIRTNLVVRDGSAAYFFSPNVVLAHPQHGESVISWIHQLTEPDHLAWLLLPFLFVALMYWHLYRARAQRSQREPVARRLSDSPNHTNPPR